MRNTKDYTLVVDEWNDSLEGDFLWSNTNFGEAVTETMTPLTWALIQFTLEDWVFLPGFSTVGNLCGLPYINISIFASIFKALRRGRKDLLDALEGTMYMRLPDEVEIPLIPISPGKVITSLVNYMRIQTKQRRGLRHLPAYLATNPDWFNRMRNRLQSEASRAGLLTLWQDEIRPHIKQGVWTVLGTANASADYTIQLRRELTSLAGPEDASTLIANLNEPSDLLASLGPVVGLAKVASGEMAWPDYLEHYGHRGPHEFEISVPRPAEASDWFERQLAQLRESPADVEAMLAEQKESFDAAWRRFLSRHPRKASAMRQRIAESARQARLREQARSEYIRDRWLVRLFALRAGELTGLGGEIFFLSLDEVLALLSGDQMAIRHVPTRKETYHRLKALPPYPAIIRGHFDAFQWAADPHRRSDIFDTNASSVSGKSNLITGSPGSAGQVEGIVRVIDHSENGHQLHEGEILVAVQTDIAWTLLFPRAAAVITDVGAPLSHAAIVARELGIPAVVGCRDATSRLEDGDRVRVDGGRGVVERLN